MVAKISIRVLLLIGFFLIVSGCVGQASETVNSSPSLLIQKTVEKTETGGTKTTETNPIFETVTFEDGNGTWEITKNLITKTADIDFRTFTKKNENKYGDDTVFSTLFVCGISQQIFFDPEKFDKWIKGLNQISTVDNNDDSNVESPSNVTIQKLGLEGYKVTSLTLSSIDWKTGQKSGECIITGKEESQRQITFYEKYVAEYEDFKKSNSDVNS